MPAEKSGSSSPWRSLALAVFACTVGFGVVVVSAVWWLAAIRDRASENAASRLRAQPGLGPPVLIERGRPAVRPADPELEFSPTDQRRANLEQQSSLPFRPASGALDRPLADRAGGSAAPGDDIFQDALIPNLQVEIPPDGMASLRRNPRRYVRATIREGAVIYTNVAIRLKGGPGSFRPVNDLPSFTVNFDKFAEKQTFHGLKKIHLNSSVQDPTYLSEKISRELLNAANVPTPRAGNARVTFNQGEMGLYVVVEGINKQFLKRHFRDARGNVYDGHSGTDVKDPLPTNAGDDPRDRTRLRALALATQEPVATRLASLQQTLDLDRFLSFVAMETMLWHWDGYTVGQNNFRIFHDRAADQMVFLPQGLDQILSKPNAPIFPPTGGMVARAVLEIPEGRREYRDRVALLSTNVFRVEAITNRIRQVAQRIQAVLGEFDPQLAMAHQQRVNGLCRRFQQRAASLQRQLSPVPPAILAEQFAAPLNDWQPRTDLGQARMLQERDENGNALLRISTSDGCTASWRTTRLLDNGRYRFHAQIKTRDVVFPENDSRAGAGLRISRFRAGQKNSGDRDWSPVTFDFEIQEDQTEVELICELRALQGDVWFDLKSLRLERR